MACDDAFVANDSLQSDRFSPKGFPVMNPFALFRFCVVAPLVLTAASVAYSIFAEATFSEQWRDILTWNGHGSVVDLDVESPSIGVIAFAVVLAMIALLALLNQVLLFFYWGPSRLFYLIGCVAFFPTALLWGLTILTPVEYLLLELSTFFTGMTLALAFYGPVAARFSRPILPPLPT